MRPVCRVWGLIGRSVVACLAALAAVLLASACDVSTVMTIDVAEDGSGVVSAVVTLDADAAAGVGDPEATLRIDDLRSDGWEVDVFGGSAGDAAGEDRAGEDGAGAGLILSGRRSFDGPESLQPLLDAVADGVFEDWTVDVGGAFAEATWEVSGGVELSGSLDQFSDDRVAAQLDGLPLGRTPEEIEAALDGARWPLTVTVRLPGPVLSTSGGGEISTDDPRAAVWSFDVVGSPTDATVTAATIETDNEPGRRFILAGLLATLGLIVLVAMRVWRGRRRID